jgi:hypothetical protein
MSNSTTKLDLLSAAQAGKEATANAALDAASPATLFGRRASTTTGLTWGFFGGGYVGNGALIDVANGTVALTASAVNYIEASPALGTLTKVTSQFTPGKAPQYTLYVGATTVNSYIDHRMHDVTGTGKGFKVVAMTDANYTMTAEDARARILEFTGTLTTSRQVVMPTTERDYALYNNTTGGHQLDFKTSGGSGTIIAAAKHAMVYCNSASIQRLSADA